MSDFERIKTLKKTVEKELIKAISDFNTAIEKYHDFLSGKEPSKRADRSYELTLSKEADLAKQNIFDIANTGMFSMSTAFILMKMGKNITRQRWFWAGTRVFLKAVYPTGTSENTEPYTQMVKRIYNENNIHLQTKVFPSCISDESIYAEDWCIVEHEYNEVL